MSPQRLECVELAPAVVRPSQSESASKLDALHTLRESARRQANQRLRQAAPAGKKTGINFCTGARARLAGNNADSGRRSDHQTDQTRRPEKTKSPGRTGAAVSYSQANDGLRRVGKASALFCSKIINNLRTMTREPTRRPRQERHVCRTTTQQNPSQAPSGAAWTRAQPGQEISGLKTSLVRGSAGSAGSVARRRATRPR